MYPIKFPSTPHWPWSEKLHRNDTYHTNPERFVGVPVIITEKLDGGNTQLVNGNVYARSIQSPSNHGWMAMVKKHHAWKTVGLPYQIYGEDVYGVHSIKYDAVPEDETFYVFCIVNNGQVQPWSTITRICRELNFNTVPVLEYRRTFNSVDEITNWFKDNLKKKSSLGPTKEGFVMRVDKSTRIWDDEFRHDTCKYVRKNHVQTNEHWTKNWQRCDIK